MKRRGYVDGVAYVKIEPTKEAKFSTRPVREGITFVLIEADIP
jgi:hypothetical protein